ncbi:peptidoglycan-binding domain-containing protein [Streptomyces fungicidicus]|uniref:peptidoglycan-binding domain-containing protein n=1 Tax=Streptomyces fungicidicus TaxID=68203 RepID=UPI0033CAAE92
MNRNPRALWAAVTTALTVAALTALGMTQAPDTASANDDPVAGARQAAPALPATNTQDKPTLRNGRRGQAVTELQQRLTARGHTLTADGVFGPRTETAVKAFQTQHGLQADGIAGPQTWNALLTPPSTKPTAPRPATYSLKFTKNQNDPLNSKLALLRDGKLVDSYRAGSGMGSTDECARGQGWLPNGTYKIKGYETNRGGWNYNPRVQVQGYAIEIEDRYCTPSHGQQPVKRTDMIIHSEMLADGTQAVNVPLQKDDFWRWDNAGDYSSNGCIKLAPNDIKDLFRHLERVGWPKNLTLQVS